MITLGLDPHPGSHTVAALDKNGASLAHLAVPNTPDGAALPESISPSTQPIAIEIRVRPPTAAI